MRPSFTFATTTGYRIKMERPERGSSKADPQSGMKRVRVCKEVIPQGSRAGCIVTVREQGEVGINGGPCFT